MFTNIRITVNNILLLYLLISVLVFIYVKTVPAVGIFSDKISNGLVSIPNMVFLFSKFCWNRLSAIYHISVNTGEDRTAWIALFKIESVNWAHVIFTQQDHRLVLKTVNDVSAGHIIEKKNYFTRAIYHVKEHKLTTQTQQCVRPVIFEISSCNFYLGIVSIVLSARALTHMHTKN